MTTNRTRILSVILTVFLLLSVLPFSVSAAEALKATGVTKWPTLTYLNEDGKVHYGQALGDALKINDDEVVLDAAGNQVAGHFEFINNKTLAQVSTAETGTKSNLTFVPDDTTAYTGFRKLFCADVTYICVETIPLFVDEVNDPLVASSISEAGATLSTSTLSGGKMYNPYAPADSQSIAAVWRWENPDTIATASGYYTAYFYDTGYTKQTKEVWVEVGMSSYTGLGDAPTAIAPETYAPGMTYADIKLEGGTAFYKGEVISGHYEWRLSNLKIANYLGGAPSTQVKFIPDNSEYSSDFAELYMYITVKMPPKPVIELADGCTEMVVQLGSWYTHTNAARVGLTFKNGLDANIVSVKFFESYSDKPVGLYENAKIELTVDDEDGAYGTESITLPLRIIPAITDKPFGKVEAKAIPGGEEGAFEIGVQFSDEGKTGTVTLRVNGETVAEGIEPTYKAGEPTKWKFTKFIAPATGTYNVEAEYIAGDNDGYTYRNPIITTSFDAVVRVVRKITVGENIRLADKVYYGGDRATVEFTGNTDTFGGWEIKDATGKVYTAAELSGKEYTVREEEMNMTKLTFVIPDCDITVTAKSKTIIPATPDGGFDFASIWNAFVEFFAGVSENCPFISGIVELVEFVVNFFTGLFK